MLYYNLIGSNKYKIIRIEIIEYIASYIVLHEKIVHEIFTF